MRALVFIGIVSFALVSSGLLSGCFLSVPQSECAANPAQTLLVKINEARAREGVPPVRPNAHLARAAAGHARELASGKTSTHTGSTGSDPLKRIREAGYVPLAWGENFVIGSNNPRTIIEAWLKSPGHREVLLDPAYAEVGLGGVPDSDPPAWVADFGAEKENPKLRCHPWRGR